MKICELNTNPTTKPKRKTATVIPKKVVRGPANCSPIGERSITFSVYQVLCTQPRNGGVGVLKCQIKVECYKIDSMYGSAREEHAAQLTKDIEKVAGTIGRDLEKGAERIVLSQNPVSPSQAEQIGIQLYTVVSKLIPKKDRGVDMGSLNGVCRRIERGDPDLDLGGFDPADISYMVKKATIYLERIQQLGETGMFLYAKAQRPIEKGVEAARDRL